MVERLASNTMNFLSGGSGFDCLKKKCNDSVPRPNRCFFFSSGRCNNSKRRQSCGRTSERSVLESSRRVAPRQMVPGSYSLTHSSEVDHSENVDLRLCCSDPLLCGSSGGVFLALAELTKHLRGSKLQVKLLG